nr:hypothetical protein [Mycoplasmopsis bovis]
MKIYYESISSGDEFKYQTPNIPTRNNHELKNKYSGLLWFKEIKK